MDQYAQLTYLVTFSHLRSWKSADKNILLMQLKDKGISLSEFFSCDYETLTTEFMLTDKQANSLIISEKDLAKNALMVEDMMNRGFNLIDFLDDKRYPPLLKKNLDYKYCPSMIYAYGNIDLFYEPSISIVGSRSASDVALTFTENIAKIATKDMKVVVSGFAKGVDRKSLDATLENHGRAIIVLPQGILTASKITKDYYTQINEGEVLVISAFYPNGPWSVAYAMARNPYIYGLGEEIYVAESGTKGGTWSGAIDGLRKGRNIFVRNPDKTEKNGNINLIQKGCTPIDIDGNIIEVDVKIIPNNKPEQQELDFK